ncbi:MAG TPA: hypothetical protein VFI91_02385 [Longimicrobiaceae bacterium]|nr:hypothetical protein [Longimicrobiaceae bacterium]
MNQQYTPISCDAHDELLARATLKRETDLTYANEQGESVRVRGVIVDVYSRDGAEYLRTDNGLTIRLDQLQELDGAPLPTDPATT